jgi:hypothetical protein
MNNCNTRKEGITVPQTVLDFDMIQNPRADMPWGPSAIWSEAACLIKLPFATSLPVREAPDRSTSAETPNALPSSLREPAVTPCSPRKPCLAPPPRHLKALLIQWAPSLYIDLSSNFYTYLCLGDFFFNIRTM